MRSEGLQADAIPPMRAVPDRASKAPQVDKAAVRPDPVEKPAEELRIGGGQIYRRGDTRAADLEERPDFESRAPARRLTDEEVQAGGLLKDRVVEVVEMREEPVISREVVVREEVLIRKTVNERSEIVRDTVRHTEVEVDELRSPN